MGVGFTVVDGSGLVVFIGCRWGACVWGCAHALVETARAREAVWGLFFTNTHSYENGLLGLPAVKPETVN